MTNGYLRHILGALLVVSLAIAILVMGASDPLPPPERRSGDAWHNQAGGEVLTPRTTSIGPDPTAPALTGYAIIITNLERYRYNLVLQAIPAPIWDSPEWQAINRVVDGAFPVRIWRYRQSDGTLYPMTTLRVPANDGGQLIWPVPEEREIRAQSTPIAIQSGFRTGDQLIVEYTVPGLLVTSRQGPDVHPNERATPFASQIDRHAQAPDTLYSIRKEFRP